MSNIRKNRRIVGIYKILNVKTGDFYIGSASFSVKQRWSRHKRDLKNNKHCNIFLQRSWNKYGESNFKLIIVEECNINDCIFLEQKYIDKLSPKYNLCKTAGSRLGVPQSAETKRKISKANLGKKKSSDHIKNISKSLTGRKRPELKDNIEWRRNLGKDIVCKNNCKIYRTIKEAANDLNIRHESIGRSIKFNKSVKGYTFYLMSNVVYE